MTTTTFHHNNIDAVELGMQAAAWLGLQDRSKDIKGKRLNECLMTMNAITEKMADKWSFELWGESLATMLTQYPEHDWLSTHAPQVVWFSKNFIQA